MRGVQMKKPVLCARSGLLAENATDEEESDAEMPREGTDVAEYADAEMDDLKTERQRSGRGASTREGAAVHEDGEDVEGKDAYCIYSICN